MAAKSSVAKVCRSWGGGDPGKTGAPPGQLETVLGRRREARRGLARPPRHQRGRVIVRAVPRAARPWPRRCRWGWPAPRHWTGRPLRWPPCDPGGTRGCAAHWRRRFWARPTGSSRTARTRLEGNRRLEDSRQPGGHCRLGGDCRLGGMGRTDGAGRSRGGPGAPCGSASLPRSHAVSSPSGRGSSGGSAGAGSPPPLPPPSGSRDPGVLGALRDRAGGPGRGAPTAPGGKPRASPAAKATSRRSQASAGGGARGRLGVGKGAACHPGERGAAVTRRARSPMTHAYRPDSESS